MEILLFLLLVGSAAVLFIPGIMKERSLDSPLDTVSDFRRGMNVLAYSTHEYQQEGRSLMSSRGETEPYVRRNTYPMSYEDQDRDFVPYPSNRMRAEAAVRRQRILITLWIVTIITAILALFPSIRWILPLHIAILVILATYSMLVLIVPRSKRYH